MSIDEQRLFRELGQIGTSLENINKVVEKIPDLSERVALSEQSLKWIGPRVVEHEKTQQQAVGRASTIALAVSSIIAFLVEWFAGSGAHNGGSGP